VFNPPTKDPAGKRPRILINDGFGTHESLELLKFCSENNIVLCRLPSHTSHKLQPCVVGVFDPLKTVYRKEVEKLYRGGSDTIGKQHFTLLYDRARQKALLRRNILSGWSKAGLQLFSPQRVLNEIQKPIVNNSYTVTIINKKIHDVHPLQPPSRPSRLTHFEHDELRKM
jgi:DDE superfamily endonuclease